MKRTLLAAALAALFAAPALAGSCPMHMKQFDEAVAKNPSVSAADLTQAKALRSESETLHKAGKHAESMDAIGKAKKLLKM